MQTTAVLLQRPEELALGRVSLTDPTESDVVVAVDWSGISTGTEKLLWSGRMPPFPGMGYPLVPGYESVGRIVEAGPASGRSTGDLVFVPGSRGFADVRGLFGGAAARLVVSGAKAVPIPHSLGERGVLLALAATALHVTAVDPSVQPDLIVGHGVLGRLIARIAVAHGARPTVWETNATRSGGAEGYPVLHPDADDRRDYRTICDASGAVDLLDTLIGRLAPGGEVVLAGFYSAPLSFSFPPAFLREARIRIAAEWRPADLETARAMVEDGTLSLDNLITHRSAAMAAPDAYRTAFTDDGCLKMVLDWRNCA